MLLIDFNQITRKEAKGMTIKVVSENEKIIESIANGHHDATLFAN